MADSFSTSSPEEQLPAGWLPFDEDAADPDSPRIPVIPEGALGGAPPQSIAYVGRAFTREEFSAYVQSLHFPNPPRWIVLHHTSVPGRKGFSAGGWQWDAGQDKLPEAGKVTKRLELLGNIFSFYAGKGWGAGPQLFVDDLRIYVGTPLTQEGIHAADGNATGTGAARRFSLGLEVIGHFERDFWDAATAENVAWAVAVLRHKLQTFTFTSGRGPGYISEHRMYNKPACPGAAVRPERYLPLMEAAYRKLTAPPPVAAAEHNLPPGTFPVDRRFQAAHTASGGIWQPARLTPGYAVAEAETLPDGQVIQRFQRGVARLTSAGSVEWLLLEEAAGLFPKAKRR